MQGRHTSRFAQGCAVVLLTALIAVPAGANDTTLNVNVDPPRQLSTYYGNQPPPVRMAGEHITVHFGREQSAVEVEFTFENTSEDFINCTAGFPDEDLLARYMWFTGVTSDTEESEVQKTFGYPDAFGDVAASGIDDSVLHDFAAWSRSPAAPASANKPLETKLLRIERIAYEAGALESLGSAQWKRGDVELNDLMFCRAFSLELPPHGKLLVGHRYTTQTGSNAMGQTLFSYTLGTGRTWQGTIGKATIDLYFEDGIKPNDLHYKRDKEDFYAATNPGKRDWKQLDPLHLCAFWSDFEPVGQRAYLMVATQPAAPPPE